MAGRWNWKAQYDVRNHYNFEEGSGTAVADVGQAGNDATATGMTWTTGAEIGNAGSFDGSNDYVTTPATGSESTAGNMGLASASDWTICCFYKGTDTNTNANVGKGLISWDDGNAWASFAIEGGKPFYGHYDGSWQSIASATSVADNTWHHIAMVNRSDETADIYIDGVIDVTNQSSALSGGGSYFQPYHFMRSGIGSYTAGALDQVRIYERVLTPVEIAHLSSLRA